MPGLERSVFKSKIENPTSRYIRKVNFSSVHTCQYPVPWVDTRGSQDGLHAALTPPIPAHFGRSWGT